MMGDKSFILFTDMQGGGQLLIIFHAQTVYCLRYVCYYDILLVAPSKKFFFIELCISQILFSNVVKVDNSRYLTEFSRFYLNKIIIKSIFIVIAFGTNLSIRDHFQFLTINTVQQKMYEATFVFTIQLLNIKICCWTR